MKKALISTLLASASASPIGPRQLGGLGGGGLGGLGGLGGGSSGGSSGGSDSSGDCKDVIFIFARGSTEPGTMGMTVGPGTCSALKQDLGDGAVSCRGVGGGYSADIASNAQPAGTSQAGIQTGASMFKDAAQNCPNSKIVAGGYSQGSALIANVVSELDGDVKDKTKGVVLFGYTKNAQTDGSIPNYPKDQTKVYCAQGDGVCTGTLTVTAAHLSYQSDTGPAAKFLVSTLQGGGSSSDSSSSDSSGDSSSDSSGDSSSGSSGNSSSGGSSSGGLGGLGGGSSGGLPGLGGGSSGGSSGGLGGLGGGSGLGGLGGGSDSSSGGLGGLGGGSGSSGGLGGLGGGGDSSSGGLGGLGGGSGSSGGLGGLGGSSGGLGGLGGGSGMGGLGGLGG